mgnify:CR=1 FL=1
MAPPRDPQSPDLQIWNQIDPKYWHFSSHGRILKIPREGAAPPRTDQQGNSSSWIKEWFKLEVPDLEDLGAAAGAAFAPLDVLTETTVEAAAQVPKLFTRPAQVDAPTVFRPGGARQALAQFRERPMAEQVGLSFLDPAAAIGGSRALAGVGRRLLPVVAERAFRKAPGAATGIPPEILESVRASEEMRALSTRLGQLPLEAAGGMVEDVPVNRINLERFYQSKPYLKRDPSETLLAHMDEVNRSGGSLRTNPTQELVDSIRRRIPPSPSGMEAPTGLSRTDIAGIMRSGQGAFEPSMFEPELLPTVQRGLPQVEVSGTVGASPATAVARRSLNERIEGWINRRLTGSDIMPDAPLGEAERIRKGAGLFEVANLFRPIMTSLDHGSPFRTALATTIAHPLRAMDAFRDSMQAISTRGARHMETELRSAKHYDEIKRAEPDMFTTARGQQQADEYYGSRIAHKIPGLGVAVRMSEDLFNTYNNALRYSVTADTIDMFERFGHHASRAKLDEGAKALGFADVTKLRKSAKDLKEKGKFTPEMDDLLKSENARFQDIKQWAIFVKHSSGRGGLGPLRQYNRILAFDLFAPRWILAHPQMIWDVLNPMPLAGRAGPSPLVRAQMAKDLTAYIGVGATIMGLAALGGARVETDPKSSNFGMIQLGNTRVNIYGALTTPIRYFAQMQGEARTNVDTGIESPQSAASTAWRLFRSKQAPGPALALDLGTGFARGNQPEDFMGRPYEATPQGVLDQAYRHTAPLFIGDLVDQIRTGSPKTAPLMAPAFFGLTVNTYEAAAQKFWLSHGGTGQLRDQADYVKVFVKKAMAKATRQERIRESRR